MKSGQELHGCRVSDAPYSIAAPSFVIPDTVAANCRFLSGKVDEVALVFFETEACLKYSGEDLPPELARLPLRYHVHLPLDLPWSSGATAVAKIIDALARKVDYLRPTAYVLHPPADASALEALARALPQTAPATESILLENVEGNDLTDCATVAMRAGYNFCLDIGHYLAFGQDALEHIPGIWERVRMLHLYGPGPKGEHGPLAELDTDGRKTLRSWLERAKNCSTLVAEVFREAHLAPSLDELNGLLDEWGMIR